MFEAQLPLLREDMSEKQAIIGGMKDDLQYMSWLDDIVGHRYAISRLQEEISEQSKEIEAMEGGLPAYLLYRTCRVLRHGWRWIHAQYVVACTHIWVWRLQFHMWNDQRRKDAE